MLLAANQIYQGDARDLLQQIEPNSVACSIWSLPYHVGKEYEKEQNYLAVVNRRLIDGLMEITFVAVNITHRQEYILLADWLKPLTQRQGYISMIGVFG